ncbi:MAG: response regulator [Defluviitaleaceae bacterium]|nr:response regulator [Defluviitaleaceae bacterium]MCL2263302.1 response regulator [Defluviitaleaceae bacterium]
MDFTEITSGEINELNEILLNSSPFIINIWDETPKLIDTNLRSLEVFGLKTKAQFIDNFHDLSPEYQPCGTLSKEKALAYVQEAFGTGRVQFEWMHQTAMCEPLPTEITLIRFMRKEKRYLVAYGVDLRPVKAALEKEYKAIGIVQAIFDSAPLIINIWDGYGNMVSTSEHAIVLHNLSNKEQYIERFKELSPEYQPCGTLSSELVPIVLGKAYNEGFARFEWMHCTLDGKPVPTEVTLVRFVRNGETMLIAYTVDLTQVKAAMARERKLEVKLHEKKINEAQETIRHREKLLHTINEASEILLTAKQEDTMTALMKGMEIVGRCLDLDRVQIWRNEEVNGELHFVMRYEWLSDIGKEKRMVPNGLSVPYSHVPGWHEMFMSGGCINGPISQLSEFEAGFLGHYEMVSIVCLPLFINQDFIGFFSVDDCQYERTYTKDEMDMFASAGLMFTNVFNRNLQAEKLEVAQKQAMLAEVAEESNKAKSRFLARMSHEIRTPISAVMGISEIQLQKSDLPPIIEEAFAKIHNSSVSLLGLVNDILDLSKIEAGKMTLLPEKYDTTSMINDVVHLHLPYLGTKDINFHMNVDETLPAALMGDVLRIKQIMSNLLSNAFKYTEHGSVELDLRRKTRDNGDFALIFTISDTGTGMTPEQVDDFKNDYTRYNERSNHHIIGTGLGMPIVYNLIQMMNAEINVESEFGKGTTIVVEIPQEVVGSEILGKEVALQLQQFKINSASKRFEFTPEPMPYGSVLVVDDIDANLYVARGLLAFYGLKIDLCESGWEAIEKIHQGKVYDIIFMDQMMPEIDGTETMRTLRDMGYTQPIIALTANALIGQAEEFIKEGFDGFISKPIQTKHLNTILMKHIRDKQPPDIIAAAKASATAQVDINNFQNSVELLEKLRVDFAKKHGKTFDALSKALDADDIKTAHLLAHTLKGLAGLINENTLMQAANDTELTLAAKEMPSAQQLDTLKSELTRVIDSIPLPSFVPASKDFDKDAAVELLGKLAPLLETGNTDSLSLLDELRKIPETAILCKQIENLDFEAAATSLEVLQSIL